MYHLLFYQLLVLHFYAFDTDQGKIFASLYFNLSYIFVIFLCKCNMFRISSLKKNIDRLVAAAFGFTIIFLFTRHGCIGLCPDGVEYTTTAANICKNATLV